jgi:hypothetical protein
MATTIPRAFPFDPEDYATALGQVYLTAQRLYATNLADYDKASDWQDEAYYGGAIDVAVIILETLTGTPYADDLPDWEDPGEDV